MSSQAAHRLVGKVVRWSHGPNVLVGPATRYDDEDDELFIIPDGLIHGHYWVPAKACTEEASHEMKDRERQRLREAADRMSPLSSEPHTSLDLALVREAAYRASERR